MNKKVCLISLGCSKNLVDSEHILGLLKEDGYQITNNEKECDILVINTCGFIDSSKKESINIILSKINKPYKLVVTGCLIERYLDELKKEIPEVDLYIPIRDYYRFNELLSSLDDDIKVNKELTSSKRVITTGSFSSYLRIGDGCDNRCAYCAIPLIRGPYKSRPLDEIISEAHYLKELGIKEIIVLEQDTTKYGVDLYGESKIVELVQKLSSIDGLVWIRLLYCYPELMTDALIDEIATNPKVVKYVDIPLQHINDAILKKMNRRSDTASIVALFDKLHQRNIQVRSTFICGFPGETQQTVDQIDEFLNKYKLRNVGFFAYSREEGTAAAKFDNQVHPRTKQKYVKQLYRTQYAVAHENNLADIGKTYLCVIDQLQDFDGDFYTYRARTEFMSPEIDGVVYATSDKQFEVGQFVNVKIVDVYEYDLAGEVLL